METTWLQRDNQVILKINNKEYFANMPDNYKLNLVHPTQLQLVEYILLYKMNHNIKTDSIEYPKYIHNNRSYKGKSDHTKIGLAFSAGFDSTAAYLLLPKEDTIPIYIYDKCNKNNIYNINNNAMVAIKSLQFNNIMNPIIIKTNFQQIYKDFYDDSKTGWSHTIGHASIVVLLAHHLKIKYISFGKIAENAFLKNSTLFKNQFVNDSYFHYLYKIFMGAGLNIMYPVGGCTEIVTYNIVKNANMTPYCTCCPKINKENKLQCEKCFKCWRKYAIAGKKIGFNMERKLENKNITIPLIYILKYKIQLESKFNIYRDFPGWELMDLHFMEKYYMPYLEKNQNGVHMVPLKFQNHIKSKLQKYNIKPMNKNDIISFEDIGYI